MPKKSPLLQDEQEQLSQHSTTSITVGFIKVMHLFMISLALAGLKLLQASLSIRALQRGFGRLISPAMHGSAQAALMVLSGHG